MHIGVYGRTIVALLLAGCPSKDKPKDEPTPVVIEPKTEVKKIEKPVEPKPEPKPPIDPKAPRLLTRSSKPEWFGVAPGYAYWCDRDDGKVHGTPKRAGDDEIVIGACDGAFQFIGDLQGVYYCGRKALLRSKPGSTTATQVAVADGCLLGELDNTDVYFIVPGFKSIENPGLYKVSRNGGDAVRILPAQTGEQIMFALDGDDIWIAKAFAGTVSKMAKTGKSPVTVISGQKTIVGVGTDTKYVYWMNQVGDEVRRRLKSGGPIETVGTNADQPLVVYGGTAYWIDKGKPATVDGQRQAVAKLMRLAPGAKQAEVIASELNSPHFEVDADGVYYTHDDTAGIMFIPK
jgi:hypothetical protein